MADSGVRRTERLLLRPPTHEDFGPLVALHVDPRTNRHRPGGPPEPGEVQSMLERLVDEWRTAELSYWTVLRDGSVVGMAGVRPYDFEGSQAWNLYYRFTPDAWGAGLAREAAACAVDAASMVGTRRMVVARIRPDNTAAIKVAERVGLVRRGGVSADGFVVCAATVTRPLFRLDDGPPGRGTPRCGGHRQ